MLLHNSGGIFFLSTLLVAQALDGHKLDVTEQSFAKAESDIKSIMHESEKKIVPEEEVLTGLSKAVKTLEKIPDKPNAADAPKNPRSTVNGTFPLFAEIQDEHASKQAYTDETGTQGKQMPASFVQVAAESEEEEEEDEDEAEQSEDDESEGEDEKEEGEEEDDEEDKEGEEDHDGEGAEVAEDTSDEGDGKEEEEGDEMDEDAEENGEGEDEEQMRWGKVPDRSGEASLVDDEELLMMPAYRKLMTRRDEHRRRGVPDMPFPTEAPLEASSSETTTTTGKYPLGYIGPGHEAVEKDYKDKWAVMPDPNGRAMEAAWGWDHPIDYHEHAYDGKPGRCDGRRRVSYRRRVCDMSHRRRRGHRRRRRHHRRRSHEYRRRRRRVHRRRRVTKDKSHRRRSHRRRLDRGDPSAAAKMNKRRNARGNDADATEAEKMQGQKSDEESLIERNTASAGSDMETVEVNANALTSQDQSALMRRHNFDLP
eukprot:gnl/MRDRNA2_/MRDRNA2_92893_c0_seq1.p1 gnl/MRDRNA2_/MRDRNA2_92893_c0~~gnl/MRDRNA2_/MRDRNA2_92893_c0_seq1.p1  ORF type:complete len:481 (-),score=139.90 gnl/MRDRNA2_/MRDRNA2_92893_c0_seq1:5-1447(-)